MNYQAQVNREPRNGPQYTTIPIVFDDGERKRYGSVRVKTAYLTTDVHEGDTIAFDSAFPSARAYPSKAMKADEITCPHCGESVKVGSEPVFWVGRVRVLDGGDALPLEGDTEIPF